jgi:hypothetical protein
MNKNLEYYSELNKKGFSITKPIFNETEMKQIVSMIKCSKEKYAIRQLINKIPEIQQIIFKNAKFKKLFEEICKEDYFLSKAIFFNKPSKSNWFVSSHQDLSISVRSKIEAEGYSNWTNKNGQLGVIPPKEVLENTVTFRIHLDNTNETNGALKVIPSSHLKGVIRIDEEFEKSNYGNEETCNVEKGGVMLMKPLLLHSSQKSVSDFDRRVIHLEFCNKEIPMQWLEKRKVS